MRVSRSLSVLLVGAFAASAWSQNVELSGDAYDALRGCEKQSRLWDQIKSTDHLTTGQRKLPPYETLGLLDLGGMALQSVAVKLNRRSDVAPRGWTKHLHARGSVAKIKYVSVGEHPYTGMFKGLDCGFIRLSLTSRPPRAPAPGKGVAPGAAIKFLVDGKPSVNVSALPSLIPQGHNFNFFENALSNIVPRWMSMGASLVHTIFGSATKYPERLNLAEVGSIQADGQVVPKPVYPYQIFLVPGDPQLQFAREPHEIREDFHKIPEGTVLYRVQAVTKDFDYSTYKEEDKADLLAASVHIGNIVTTSSFLSSEFGDSKLFFRHQKMD